MNKNIIKVAAYLKETKVNLKLDSDGVNDPIWLKKYW